MIYLDANVVIRLVKGDPVTQVPVVARLGAALPHPDAMGTSLFTRLEVFVGPVRIGDAEAIALYEDFFADAALQVFEIDAPVIDAAIDFRAKYGFKSPDAVHRCQAGPLRRSPRRNPLTARPLVPGGGFA
jgi:predicted nucleic acid-binding protein